LAEYLNLLNETAAQFYFLRIVFENFDPAIIFEDLIQRRYNAKHEPGQSRHAFNPKC